MKTYIPLFLVPILILGACSNNNTVRDKEKQDSIEAAAAADSMLKDVIEADTLKDDILKADTLLIDSAR